MSDKFAHQKHARKDLAKKSPAFAGNVAFYAKFSGGKCPFCPTRIKHGDEICRSSRGYAHVKCPQ